MKLSLRRVEERAGSGRIIHAQRHSGTFGNCRRRPCVCGRGGTFDSAMAILFEEGRYLEVGAAPRAPMSAERWRAPAAERRGTSRTATLPGPSATRPTSMTRCPMRSSWTSLSAPMSPIRRCRPLAALLGKIDSTSVDRRRCATSSGAAYRPMPGCGPSGRAAASRFPAGIVAGLGGPAQPYTLTSNTDQAFGYLVGVAYEKPDIALRVALTYNSLPYHMIFRSKRASAARRCPQPASRPRYPNR